MSRQKQTIRALINEFIRGEPPWEKWKRMKRPRVPKNEYTLKKWRKYGYRRGRGRGGVWTCTLCKRPIARNEGRVQLTVGGARPIRRSMCVNCRARLKQWIIEQETLSRGGHLAPLRRWGRPYKKAEDV